MVGRMGSVVGQVGTVVGLEAGKHHSVIVDAGVFGAVVVREQHTGSAAEGLLGLGRS